MKTQIAVFLLLLLSPGMLLSKTIRQTDRLNLLAYSPDGQFLVFESYDSSEGIGGHSPGRFWIVHEKTEEIAEEIPIAYNEYMGEYENTEPEEMEKINQQLKSKALEMLKSRNYVFDVQSFPFTSQTPFRIDYADIGEATDRNGGYYELQFYVEDVKTKYRYNVQTVTVLQTTSREAARKDEESSGFTSITDNKFIPVNKIMVVFYRTPMIMEFMMGYDGAIIINTADWTRFYNGAGMQYYKSKQYKVARDYFQMALSYDPNYVKAVYNIACMYGLLEKPDMAVRYLNRLKQINDGEAKEKIKKSLTDPDFQPIRSHPLFVEWQKSIQ